LKQQQRNLSIENTQWTAGVSKIVQENHGLELKNSKKIFLNTLFNNPKNKRKRKEKNWLKGWKLLKIMKQMMGN